MELNIFFFAVAVILAIVIFFLFISLQLNYSDIKKEKKIKSFMWYSFSWMGISLSLSYFLPSNAWGIIKKLLKMDLMLFQRASFIEKIGIIFTYSIPIYIFFLFIISKIKKKEDNKWYI